MNQQDVFASTQIIMFNPIMKESLDYKTQYFMYLRKLIRLAKWDKRKYTKAQLEFYKGKLCGEQYQPSAFQKPSFDSSFSYLIPFDLAIMVAYHSKIVSINKSEIIIKRIVSDFGLPKDATYFLQKAFYASVGDEDAWSDVLQYTQLQKFKDYIILEPLGI